MVDNNWPVYKKELLAIGNPESSTGICTLWTPKEKVLRKIDKDNFLVAGQCYSNQEGINLIIRHCLINKKIHRIVLCGIDMTHTGDILLALKEKGVDSNRKIVGFETEIEPEIPLDAIERFRKNVDIIDKRGIRDYSLLNDYIKDLDNKEPWGEEEVYERKPPKAPETMPSEKTSFIVRGKKVGDVWLKILDSVLRFGYIKRSQHGEDQQEIISLVSVITDENPHEVEWKDYFQFTKQHFIEYLPKLMSPNITGDVSYNYGSRLRNFQGVNQIDSMVDQLKKALYSRRAVGVTWDVHEDHDSHESPCLDLIQALVQEKLYFTAYFRSNDMFGAWPENALALRTIQYEIAKRVGVEPGDLVIVSNSAHIYEHDWEKARKIVDENLKPGLETDPRGNILIDLENGKIKISHLDTYGKPLEIIYAGSALEAYSKIRKSQIISQVDHALDIGGELAKAEIALKHNLKYVQDKSLFI